MQNDNQNDILPELIAAGVDPVTAIVVNESEKSENNDSGCLICFLIIPLLLWLVV